MTGITDYSGSLSHASIGYTVAILVSVFHQNEVLPKLTLASPSSSIKNKTRVDDVVDDEGDGPPNPSVKPPPEFETPPDTDGEPEIPPVTAVAQSDLRST